MLWNIVERIRVALKSLLYVVMNRLFIKYAHLLFKGLAVVDSLASCIRWLVSVRMTVLLLRFNVFEGSIEVPQQGILANG